MSEEQGATTNTAENSTVAIQAQVVHNPTVNQYSEQPPEKTFEFGRNHLENGVPVRARELIRDAIARGYDNAEARFHLVLSLLSNRSYRELTGDERDELRNLQQGYLISRTGNEWERGMNVVCELLKHLDDAKSDPAPSLQSLRSLPAWQREKIVRHCDLVLAGGIKDSLWAETRDTANENQLTHGRRNRAWAYFHPEPAKARSRNPTPPAVTTRDWFYAWLGTGLLITGLAVLGWILLEYPTSISLISYIAWMICGAVAVRSGYEWRYRTQRLTAKEYDYSRLNLHDVPKQGFASRVGHDFEHYAHKYAPKSADRSSWLADTRGIRNTLRNEVVELYREQRVQSDQVRWLIRYLIQDLRSRWLNGTIFAHREQYRTPLRIKALCVLVLTFGILAALTVAGNDFSTEPTLATISLFAITVGGRIAALRWWSLCSERRRFAEETLENMRAHEHREFAYERWKNKLHSTRPTEHDMEMWLQCDKILLIEEALQHYNLAWQNIIAHTIVQTPASCRRRARTFDGPWRYQRYQFQLFLITTDGVRELNRWLYFETATFHGRERGHFRFDAVSSLQVTESEVCKYSLELTLTNGPARIIDVTDPHQDLEHPISPNPEVSRVELDSAGFNHALYVLEGIAAEGKAWIHQTTISRNNRASLTADSTV